MGAAFRIMLMLTLMLMIMLMLMLMLRGFLLLNGLLRKWGKFRMLCPVGMTTAVEKLRVSKARKNCKTS